MEALLIRIDTLRDHKQYLSILKAWLAELKIAHGRLITMGEFHLLFIVASEAQIDKLLEFYATKEIDTNSKDELCVDKFIDIVGRKKVEASGCKGFLDMNILNKSLLEKMLVHEWHGKKEWLDSALETPRTRALLAWREEVKALRRDRRKKSAQDRDAAKLLKNQQAEAEAAAKAAAAAKKEAGSDDDDAEKEDGEESDADEIKLKPEGAAVKDEIKLEPGAAAVRGEHKVAEANGEEFIRVPAAKPQRPQGKQQMYPQAKTGSSAPQGNAPTKPKHQQQKRKQGQQKKRANSQEWKQKSKQQKRTN